RAFEELTGCRESEIIGKNTVTLFTDIPEEEYIRQDLTVLHEKRTIRTEQAVTTPDGRMIMLDTLLTPFWAPNGEPLGLLGISRDITHRKTTEGELRAAKEAAESASHTKSTFLSTITHELRTPMNGVLGLSNLLMETDLSIAQFDLVNAIHTSGNTLLALINDILDFSKIEANKVDLEIHSFDLRLCIENVLDLVAAQATTKGLTLAYLVAPHIPVAINQDETRLRQILANLLSNAVKFSDHGEIVVHVQGEAIDPSSTGQQMQGSVWGLHFTVSDCGMGIPHERIDRIFEPFSQVDSTIHRRFGGTGLGLAISKRLTELMGGTMWAESEIGNGSRFHFTLQAQPSEKQPAPWVESTPILDGRRVLVIEQNSVLQNLLTQQLNTWGVNVTEQSKLPWQMLSEAVGHHDVVIVDTTETAGYVGQVTMSVAADRLIAT
ncbi:MAG: PAS domain S-box protein, partial [Caldilineaceae bacterium]|nr:PAS domain S-box protein [Caldilineaceae bacterium]